LRLLFDTNVVLDVMLDREPHVAASADALSRAEAGDVTGCICATTITTIHYLASRALGAERSLAEVRKLLSLFEIAPVNRTGSEIRVNVKSLELKLPLRYLPVTLWDRRAVW